MAEQQKIVRGGFRATLALIISIIALILAFIAFDRSGGRQDLNAQVKDLQTKLEKMKQETSEQVNKVRSETANTLEKITRKLKKEEAQE